MIQTHFTGEKIFSNTQEAFSMHEKSSFGEKKGQRIEYALIEALFLVQEKKILVFSGNKALSFDALLKKIRKFDKKVETKLAVFTDLRKRGYVIKTALRYGAEFRVYEKGIKPKEDHARWILYTVREHEMLSWHDFAAKNRIAHSTNKNLLLAIVDEESDVSYYEIKWIRP